ncbi:MAG: M3 family oligoendopeptidase [Lachnospiraceae bacterium]
MKKFSDIQYERPDVTALAKEMKAVVKRYQKAANYEEAKNILFEAEKKQEHAGTMMVVANIRSTVNTADKFYEDEMKAINKAAAKLMPVSKKMTKAQLASPFRADFDKEFGPLMNKDAEEQLRLMSMKVVPAMIKEANLGQEYSKTVAACKTDFRGEECNFYGLLKHMQSTDRTERKEAFEAWAKMYEGISAKLDEQYDALVKLRVKQAKKLKFDSYTDMAYVARQRYDYTAKDVEAFRKQVVEIIVPACQKLYDAQKERLGIDKLHYYDEQLVFPEGNAMPHGTKDEMVAAAQQMYHELSKETGEFFDFMVEHELFDLETKPNKHMGGYCTFLPEYKAPFIFSNFNGTSADVDVLTHEAGHAFQAYVSSRIQPFGSMTNSTSEINEIHSMTMEFFTYPWMDKFFGEAADKYRFAHLSEALKTIPYLVAVDEFQHRVYAKPEMSAMERRSVWREIEKIYLPWRDYDGNEFLEQGGFWMQKQHIFLYPFYYVDYALAQLCAFELFGRAQTNREEAWNDYLRLCQAGGSKGYFELLELAHLHNPFKEGSVEAAVKVVLDELKKAPY